MANKKKQKGALLPLLLIGGGAALLLSSSKGSGTTVPDPLDTFGDMTIPRGIRNNNPGNIILTSINWDGKVPNIDNTDGGYEQFVSLEYGVRAMIKNLQSYISSSIMTTTSIINKWAKDSSPGNAEILANYIAFVTDRTGHPSNAPWSLDPESLWPLVDAMTYFENRGHTFSRPIYDQAVALL